MEAIKKLYARHVYQGLLSIESVPEVIRDDVQAYVDEMERTGYLIF